MTGTPPLVRHCIFFGSRFSRDVRLRLCALC